MEISVLMQKTDSEGSLFKVALFHITLIGKSNKYTKILYKKYFVKP